MTIKDAALVYAAAGWPIVPLHTVGADGACTCGDAACRSQAKHPRTDLMPRAVQGATLDLEQIASWPEEINIGVALGAGADDLIVCDVDHEATARALAHPNLGLTDQVGVSVTGRGLHLWFKTTGSTATVNLKATDGTKLGELRGDGAYVVAPPSMHISGRPYRWAGLMAGMEMPKVPRVADSLGLIAPLFEAVGVSIQYDHDTMLPSIDVPDIAVVPQDVPEAIVATNRLTDVLLTLNGSLIVDLDATDTSGRLYGIAWRVFYESLVVEQELPLEVLAGIVKKADVVCYHKYDDRRNADKYYLLTAQKVLLERDAMAQRAERSRKTQTQITTPAGVAQNPTAQYAWDQELGALLLKRGRDYPKVANFLPLILADVEIDKGGEISRAWQVRFSLQDGTSHEFFLPAEERGAYKISEAIGRHLPAEYLVYPGMFDHVRGAAQELSEGKWTNTREYAASGWVDYGSERVYLLPGAAGAIGPNGLDASIRIDATHLPEDEPITSPALANYGRGVRVPTSPEEYALAWEAFEHLISCGPADMTMGIALQILGGPLSPAGAREVPPLVHVMGRTGSLKTSLCNAALSMFGTFDESTAPPANWGSTSNSLQTLLHTTKDLTLLVDDYKASIVRRGAHTQLIQQYADGSVRQRQTTNQRLQRTQSPRGLLLSNGEDVWEREASAEARTVTIRLRPGDIDTGRLAQAQAAVERGSMQLFGGAFLHWLARHPEVFEKQEVAVLRRAWRLRLREELASHASIHLRLLSSVATLGAIGQVVYRFAQETFPERADTVLGWVREATHALATGARERGETVEEAAPFRQLARSVVEAMAARSVCLWPTDGQSSERSRIPAVPSADIIGYWREQAGVRSVFLTSATTYAWLRSHLLRQGEQVGFSWTAARNEALDSYGGAKRSRVRVRTGTGDGDVRQLSGVEVTFAEFERAAGDGGEDTSLDALTTSEVLP